MTEVATSFVERFQQVWSAPSVERLDALTNPDVCYVQPLLADVRGREAAGAYWKRVFTLVPDLHIEVVNSAVTADEMVYIEFRIIGTFGGRTVTWPAVDRYELDELGRVRRRILYCDTAQLVSAALRPRGLLALLRAGVRPGVAAVRSRWTRR
ncbi:nuclear transport factor 2 family protein [Mycobacterium sp. pW045]|uniref:nuclear transport factor 2 family protein n=1 Tax=Mycobacterium sp. pW045 TaxID=3238984 RepID=UPI00351B42D9